MSAFTDIIHQIGTYISGLTLSRAVTVSETIVPRQSIKDLGNVVTCSLYPGTHARDRIDRSGIRSTFGINIAVTKKLTPSEDKEVEEMILLVEEIAASLDDLRTASGKVLEVLIDPVFDFNRLAENNVFTSIVKVTARAI
jgi:hypothetical protein